MIKYIKVIFVGTTNSVRFLTVYIRTFLSNKYRYEIITTRSLGPFQKFSTMVLDRQKFNMQRYISESLYIESSTKEEGTLVMNSKSEWGRQKLTRMIKCAFLFMKIYKLLNFGGSIFDTILVLKYR